MMEYVFRIFGWWMMCIVKFLFVPFGMILKPDVGEEWSWIETVLVSSSGAAMGVFIFFHFGEYIFNWLAHHLNTKAKKFTKRNRFLVRMKKRWGLNGFLVISALISVPIASVIGAKLYRHDRTALPKLIVAFSCWSVFLSTVAYAMKQIGWSF